jgi:hypothetical protein
VSNEELLEYRVEQLEKRVREQERLRKERPGMIATLIMSVCALVQASTTVLLLTGVLK